MADIDAQLEAYVKEYGEISAGGVRARMKPGRKSVDHKAAVYDTMEAADLKMYDVLQILIDKHTTIKTSIAWAKVTKEVGIDTSNYVTESPPSFVVEVVK